MKWYQKKWFTWLCLVIFFPVGLFFLWKYSNHGIKTKLLVTGFFAMLVLSSVFSDHSKKEGQVVAQSPVVNQSQIAKPASVVDEKEAFQKFNDQIQKGISIVNNDWENLWQQATVNINSEDALVQKDNFATLKNLEQKLINDTMNFDMAPIDHNISQTTQTEMGQIVHSFDEWTNSKIKTSEYLRRAIGTDQINEETFSEVRRMIDQSNSMLVDSNAKLELLRSKVVAQNPVVSQNQSVVTTPKPTPVVDENTEL